MDGLRLLPQDANESFAELLHDLGFRLPCQIGLRELDVDERHQPSAFTAFTIFWAASSRSSAEITLRPDSAMIFLPSSTFVPSRRTTSGTCRPTSFTAAMTPSAMTSQRMMPPKMLTRMPFTFGSAVMILNAAVTFSLDAPPPTSRKLAGSAP